MKAYNFLFFALLFAWPLFAQEQAVSQKEFQEFQETMQDSFRKINTQVANGKETLEIAKSYAENADKHLNFFFYFSSFILAILALFAGFEIYKNFEINKTVKKYEKEFERLLMTENETLFIKKESAILLLGKKDDSNKAFSHISDAVFKGYSHVRPIYLTSIDEFAPSLFNKYGVGDKSLKVVVVNDSLFSNLTDPDGSVRKESKQNVEYFLSKLKGEQIGLVLFGKTRLSEFNYPNLAFANQPYSVYANLNNLLKYMWAVKSK